MRKVKKKGAFQSEKTGTPTRTGKPICVRSWMILDLRQICLLTRLCIDFSWSRTTHSIWCDRTLGVIAVG